MLRSLFARIIEWDWGDASRRNPVLVGDIPTRPEPLRSEVRRTPAQRSELSRPT